VFNNEHTIEEAISSVLSQTYKNIEYIIIDGNSKDKTVSIVNKFKDEISVFISEPDKGLYDAMNKGVLASSGDVIGILNSDDLYEDKFVINDVATMFRTNPTCDMIYGDM